MKKKSLPMAARRRSAARLAAIQALYQVELTGASPDAVLRDLVQRVIGEKGIETVPDEYDDAVEVEHSLVEPDSELLTFLVRGALAESERLDAMIDAALNRDWTMERLEAVLRAILRAGAFELSSRLDVPPRVAISEYVDVAHAFYAGPEPGLVNAVLDRIAKVVRADELRGNGGA